MRLVKLASVSLNTTVGATRSNTQAAIEAAHRSEQENATLVAFPEQTIGGYAEEDLVQWRDFVAAQWSELRRFAEETKSLAIVSIVGLTVRRRDHLYNCAAVVHAGRILGLVPKEKLPSYNVFYEGRTFARGQVALYDEVDGIPFGDLVFDFGFGTMAVEVCEDLWSPDGPMRRRCYGGAELVVNLSASPFRIGIAETRREMIATRSGDNQCVILYTNLVGANDGLIFDGGAYVAQNGRMLLDGDRFRADTFCATVDLDRTRRLRTENTTWRMDQESFAMPAQAASYFEGAHAVSSGALSGVRHVRCEAQTASLKHPYPVPVHGSFFLPREIHTSTARARFCEELLNALSLGVWDYFHKTRAFKTIGVSLSGGRDSLLCLWIARRAVLLGNGLLGSNDVTKTNAVVSATLRAFFMPSQYSSGETRAAAEKTAQEMGVPFVVSPIDEAFEKELLATQALLQPGEVVTPLTRQNIQARIRAERMWNWSNSAAGLFLQTSNMSEKSVGYTTIGGDMEGALSVIANVPKTVVNYLLDYLLETTGSEAIRLTLLKPASAELADGMEDEKDLMPFPVLDACFALFAGEKMGLAEVRLVVGQMFPEHAPAVLDTWVQKFGRAFTQSIYKWVQTPLCLHVGNLDLDRERALQLPVVQHTEW